MAITEKITLVDDYSAKADKIASSSMGMGRAMETVSGVASKMGSALKSAFDRNHTVKIEEVGSEKVKARIKGLQIDLDSIAKGKYTVNVSTKMGAFKKIKSNLSEIGKKAKAVGGSLKTWAVNHKSIISAKIEAMKLSRELSKATGKKHKIKVDFNKPDTGSFMSKIKAGFSKLNPFNRFKGKKGSSGEEGGGNPNLLKSIVGGNLITGAITKGIGAVTSLAGSTVGAGMTRLENIQSAKARLRGQTNADGSRKFDNAAIKNISKSAMDAVTGTAYGFGDAVSTASSAIAAGVKEKDLGGYLKGVANVSAATGSDFNDIGAIMNKIQTTGKLQGDELMQLSDRGLPILSKIAEMKGVGDNTAREMISKGQISAEDAFKAASMAAGNSAAEMGKTREAAKMNFKAALSKLGAGLLGGNDTEDGSQGGLFGLMTPALLKVNDVLNSLVPKFKDAGDAIKDFVTGGFEKAKTAFGQVKDFIQPVIDKFKAGFEKASARVNEVIGPLKEKFMTAFDGLKEALSPLKDAFINMFANTDTDMVSVVDIVAGALNTLANIIIAVTPVIQTIADIIASYVVPAITSVISFVLDSVIPAIETVVDAIVGVLTPVFEALSDFIEGAVTLAFEGVKSAVDWAKGAFDDLVGAVQKAGDFLAGLPERIGGWVSDAAGAVWDKVTSILPGKHATGTSYFTGGLTRINERGEELIQLARGSKIYPSQKTDRIIKNEVSKDTNTSTTSTIDAPITINVYGDNKEDDIAEAISKEFKRLGVLV